ncbi:MAG: glycosyltransferase [Planctomycetia bacterium]|jgi:dolichol-phosphate mannosyltransferase
MTTPPTEPDLSIVVPTYREALNLPFLLEGIRDALAGAGIAYEVIVVDDDSPDDTAAVCAKLTAAGHPLRLIVRTGERGLSSAVLRGFAAAAGRCLACMDADLSHPPQTLVPLHRAVADGIADVAIGSRYVAGGGTDATWGLFRWLNSRVATLLAAPLIPALKDPMAGYFVVRRDVLARCDELNPVGYKILLEILCKSRATRVVEVPISFRDRVRGESKLSFAEQLRYLRHLGRLYRYRYPGLVQFGRFALVGGSGMAVDLGVVHLVHYILRQPFAVQRVAGIGAALVWNFLGNRRWTFADARQESAWGQFMKFVAACSLGACVNWGVSLACFHGVWPFTGRVLRSALAGVLAGTAFNFILCRWWAFRQATTGGTRPGRGADG